MSFEERELSRDRANPIEFLQFQRAGRIWRYTTAEANTALDGNTYTALAGLERGAIQQSDEDVSMQVEITLPRTATLCQEFIGAPHADPITLVIKRNHRGEADSEAITIWTGEVAAASFLGSIVKLLCTTEEAAFGGDIGRILYTRDCANMLYDELCGVDAADHTFGATVVALSDDLLTITVEDPADLGASPSHYKGGYLTWADGRAFILDETAAGVFVLQTPARGVVVGDLVSITRGCDRSHATCAALFDNADRFQGYELIPLDDVTRRLV
jgi:uncharacterized phage protein (TIGR02218 family)